MWRVSLEVAVMRFWGYTELHWSLKGDDWSWIAWPYGLMPVDWRRNLLHSGIFFNSMCSGASFGYFCLPSCSNSIVSQQWLFQFNQVHVSTESGAHTLLWPIAPMHTPSFDYTVYFWLVSLELTGSFSSCVWLCRSTIVCPLGSIIVWPHNNCSLLTWGDSSTIYVHLHRALD